MQLFSLLIKIPILKRILPSLLRSLLILIKKENFNIFFKNLELEINIRDPHDRELFFTNNYEEKQFEEVFLIIKKYNIEIFLDVGANSGIYSLILAKKFENLVIIGFEPITSTFKKFTRNIERNKLNKKIQKHNLGLSNKSALLNMKTNIKFGYKQSAGYHVSSDGEEKAIFVKADELLNYKNKVIFMKIDTEGHELHVLEGAEEIIKKNNIFMQIEIWDKNFEIVEKTLKNMNFVFIKKIKNDYFYKKLNLRNSI
jgi:FkbM family methyltransferase